VQGVGCRGWRASCGDVSPLAQQSVAAASRKSTPRTAVSAPPARKVDVRLPGKGNSSLQGGQVCSSIRKHDYFTPTREIRRHVRALARNHPEGWKLQGQHLRSRSPPRRARRTRGTRRLRGMGGTVFRPVHLIITMIKWIRTSRLSIKAYRAAPSARWWRTRTTSSAGGAPTRRTPVRVQGSGFRVQGSGFRVQGSGFRVQGVLGLWLKVQGVDSAPRSTPRAPAPGVGFRV